jgi:late competence protein required for DNA uptake (superfamily II DNA/RNA helicase)
MKCDNCLKEDVAVFRTNPKGEIGIFYCWECLNNNQKEELVKKGS